MSAFDTTSKTFAAILLGLSLACCAGNLGSQTYTPKGETDFFRNLGKKPLVWEFSATLPVQPPEPEGLKLPEGLIPWGAAEQEIQYFFPKSFDLSCIESAGFDHDRYCSYTRDRNAQGPLKGAGMRCWHDQFYYYSYEFPPISFIRISKGIEDRLGPPTNTITGTVQNRMGATFDQEERTWDLPNVEVVIQKRGHAGNVTKGDVTISYKRLKEQLSEKDIKATPAPF